MNLVDLVLILLLFGGAITGYRRGFVGSLTGLFSSLIGFFAALRYYPLLAAKADTTLGLNDRLITFFSKNLVLPQAVTQLQLAKTPLADLGQLLEKLHLPVPLKTQIIEYLPKLDTGMLLQNKLGDVIYQYLANAVINAVAFLVIWFLVDRLIMLVVLLFRRITDSTFIAGLDHAGGLLIGTLLTVFTLTVLLGLISPLLQVTKLAEPSLFSAIFKTIGESLLIPYFIQAFAFLTDKIAAFWL